MKISHMILSAALLLLAGPAVQGDVVFTDNFDYADGDLAGNSLWTRHSGSDPTVMVSSGAVVVNLGGGSEDVNHRFAEIGSGIAVYEFDMSVASDPITGTDFEQFAHFGRTTDGTNVTPFLGRLEVVAPNGTGDYALGIATFNSSSNATTSQDFSFGDTISISVTYDTDNDLSTLTVGGETVLATQGNQGGAVNTFAFRQSTASQGPVITIDNLVISSVAAVPEPSSLAMLAFIGGSVVVARRRRR